ncbi:hypothetical protein [Thalassotalea sp. PLHSN55]|uniref:hypothetical protein n=1 Tax=Thalassotalea sp. PLHSN55 TaxID=3435888 RepID=UPI003F870860
MRAADSQQTSSLNAQQSLSSANPVRPDGTNINEQRRPKLYQVLSDNPLAKQKIARSENLNKTEVPETANVAIFATYKSNEAAIEDVCHYIENNLSDIIQLPELFFVADKSLTQNAEQRALIANLSKQLISKVSAVLRPFQYVCTSLILDDKHQAVLIGQQGVLAKQTQLHFCHRYQWTSLGDDLNIIELPLEQGNIKVAMLTADDANITEIVEIAAQNNVHALLVPFDIQEAYEVEQALISRAVENSICIVAATREKSFPQSQLENSNNNSTAGKTKTGGNQKQLKAKKFAGLIINLSKTSQQNTAPPLVKHQHGKITKALIFPIAAVK